MIAIGWKSSTCDNGLRSVRRPGSQEREGDFGHWRRSARRGAKSMSLCCVMRTALLLLLGLSLCGCAPSRIAWQERRFMHQTAAYYSELARACDAVLHAQSWEEDSIYEVFVSKSKLPTIITDLHPDRLWLTFNSVSLDFGGGNDGFWIGWAPDATSANLWTLGANVAGSRKTVYSQHR